MYNYEDALAIALILVVLAFILLVVVVRQKLKPGKFDIPEADIWDFQKKSAKKVSLNSNNRSKS